MASLLTTYSYRVADFARNLFPHIVRVRALPDPRATPPVRKITRSPGKINASTRQHNQHPTLAAPGDSLTAAPASAGLGSQVQRLDKRLPSAAPDAVTSSSHYGVTGHEGRQGQRSQPMCGCVAAEGCASVGCVLIMVSVAIASRLERRHQPNQPEPLPASLAGFH